MAPDATRWKLSVSRGGPSAAELARLGVGPATRPGGMVAADGDELFFVANPALGLWTTAGRFA